MKLETERLIIRPMSYEDRNEIYEYRSDSIANKYQGWIPKTLSDVDLFIDKLAKKINVPNTWFQVVIVEKYSNLVIGDIGIHFFDEENKQVEVGYTLDKKYQKRGYATEALSILISYLFKDLSKHRIIASIDPNNFASIQLVERLGFLKEAHFRESLFIDGKWVDDLIFALLEKEWDIDIS